MQLSDFIQPLIIKKSEDFKPREAKAVFARTCQILSLQAFWLSIFEYLEKHTETVLAVQFHVDHQRRGSRKIADTMAAMARDGADPSALLKAISASAVAFSKARGKIPDLTIASLSQLSMQCLPANGLATLDGREQIMKQALGGELYRLRLSSLESKELDESTSQSMAAALSGRKGPRL